MKTEPVLTLWDSEVINRGNKDCKGNTQQIVPKLQNFKRKLDMTILYYESTSIKKEMRLIFEKNCQTTNNRPRCARDALALFILACHQFSSLKNMLYLKSYNRKYSKYSREIKQK